MEGCVHVEGALGGSEEYEEKRAFINRSGWVDVSVSLLPLLIPYITLIEVV